MTSTGSGPGGKLAAVPAVQDLPDALSALDEIQAARLAGHQPFPGHFGSFFHIYPGRAA